MSCGNRSPITGECIVGCGGFGSCRRGEDGNRLPTLADDLRAENERLRKRAVRAAAGAGPFTMDEAMRLSEKIAR